MKNFNKIDAHDIKLGMRFSAPIFFDDGESMFLAEDRTVKQYHLSAIEHWNIQTLLTFGHPINGDEAEELEELDELEECELVDELEEI